MYWLVCYIMCLLFFLGDLQICSISRRLLLGTFIAPTWGSVSTGDVFFFPWSVSCCLQWKWHSDACLSPTALAALAWFKTLTAESTRGSNSTSIKIKILFFSLFFLFFFFSKACCEREHHPHETVTRCSLKRNNLVDTELKEGELHWILTSDFYTMIRDPTPPPPKTKKKRFILGL